jgi:hypothetical protein
MHCWLCAFGKLRCDAATISAEILNCPRMKAIAYRRSVAAESAFQMLFVANEGKRSTSAGSPLFMSKGYGEAGWAR